MLKSKAWKWGWDSKVAPWWEEPAGEVYPLVSRWKKKGFKKFLDLGCGVGRNSILFAEKGFDVTSLDLGEEGVNKLKKAAEKLSLSINTKVADMVKLPYKNSAFDCLLAYHVIYHQGDEGINKVVGEIKRVLKKEGEAYLTFNSKNSSAFKSKNVKRISDNTIVKTEGHEKGIPHFYASKKDVERLLEDFEILEFSYLEQYYPKYTGAHYFVLAKK